jgi:hypothetical protein
LHRIRGGHKTNGNAMEGLGAGQRRGGTWWAAKNELTDRLAPRQLLTGTNSRRSRAETPPGFVYRYISTISFSLDGRTARRIFSAARRQSPHAAKAKPPVSNELFAGGVVIQILRNARPRMSLCKLVTPSFQTFAELNEQSVLPRARVLLHCSILIEISPMRAIYTVPRCTIGCP